MSVFRWPNGSTKTPWVTSEWNPARRNPVSGIIQPHNGIDLIGFPLNLSCADGVVTFARYNGGAGNEVRVRHDDGSESRYKHNARILVRVGQHVSQGTALGVMGTTGQSTGIHLHFETRYSPGGASVNPRVFMRGRLSWAGDGEIITTEDGDDMHLIKRSGGSVEASMFGARFHGPSEKERGYYVITDPDEIVDWERVFFRGGSGSAKSEPRSVYVRMQKSARRAHKMIDCALCKPTASSSIDLQPILDAIAAVPGKVLAAFGLRRS